MYSYADTGVLSGISPYLIRIETDISQGLPVFSAAGISSGDGRAMWERVRVALRSTDIRIPPARITVNIAPADIPKKGASLDLPAALGVMISMGELSQELLNGVFTIGELGLDGRIRTVKGVMPMVQLARKQGFHSCILPEGNAAEGAVIEGIRILPAKNLRQAACLLRKNVKMQEGFRVFPEAVNSAGKTAVRDLSEVRGQEHAKRVLEIAAAGFHNLLMSGPPGSGKSMLASCIPGLQPPLTGEESLEVSAIYSAAGLLNEKMPLIKERRVVMPHHTVSRAAMTGGGAYPKPGMVSLAHRGVLFMDEFPEFGADSLNLLRQPMEDRVIRINRMGGEYIFPADFQLVAAMNPCPCGYYPDLNRCTCSETAIRRYQSRIPGPILDRIDMMAEVPQLRYEELTAQQKGESSEAVKMRVCKAVKIQKERFSGSRISFNAEMGSSEVEKYCELGIREKRFMEQIYSRFRMSARNYYRLLKTARTIADLEESGVILEKHLAEAAAYRPRSGF